MIDRARAWDFITRWEGVIDHLYLDTHEDADGNPAGLVTAAVGCMFPDVHSAQMARFVHASDGRPATLTEIAAEWTIIHGCPSGRRAPYYKQFTRLALPEDAIRDLFNHRVDGFERDLTKIFPEFASYPPSAQLAMLDLSFNVGPWKVAKWTHLPVSVRARNWTACADQCHRAGDDGTAEHPTLHGQRNQATKALFLAAAQGE